MGVVAGDTFPDSGAWALGFYSGSLRPQNRAFSPAWGVHFHPRPLADPESESSRGAPEMGFLPVASAFFLGQAWGTEPVNIQSRFPNA